MQSEITIKLKYHYKCARALYKSSLYLKPDALLQVCCLLLYSRNTKCNMCHATLCNNYISNFQILCISYEKTLISQRWEKSSFMILNKGPRIALKNSNSQEEAL